MIIGVVQRCDVCSTEAQSGGMMLPEGWIMFDLRGGKEGGVSGYAWNVCSMPCMRTAIDAWSTGQNPIPVGMQNEHHGGAPEDDIAAIAAASAEQVTPAPEPLTLCAWCEAAAPGADVPLDWLHLSVGVESGDDVVCSITCGRDLLDAVLEA